MSNEAKLPLVYSCSGASSAAQMANHIAVRLDRLRPPRCHASRAWAAR
jgi:uncharacterized metal-binding protein